MSKSMIVRAASITAALALMGGATFATFSSAAANTANTFGAGTLVLKINGAGDSTSTKVFTIADAKPTDVFGPQVLDLSNTGTVNVATTKLTSIAVTPSGSPNVGDKLNLELWRDLDNTGTITDGDVQIGTTQPLTNAQWTNLDLGITLAASGHMKVLAIITFDTSADNTYQGKSATFDFNFYAEQ